MPRQKTKPSSRKPARKPAAAAPIAPVAPGATLSDAPVTVTMAQLDSLRAEVRTAQTRVAELERALEAAKTADPSNRIENLRYLIREGLLPIVRFAFANLPPSEIVGWPLDAIGHVAAMFHVMPDFAADDEVLVVEVRAFMQDVREHNIERARKREALVGAGGEPDRRTFIMDVPNGGGDPGTGSDQSPGS